MCSLYTVPRIRYLQELINTYDYNYVASLSDLDIVNKFLYGDSTLLYFGIRQTAHFCFTSIRHLSFASF